MTTNDGRYPKHEKLLTQNQYIVIGVQDRVSALHCNIKEDNKYLQA
jgi:hypothetical protein